MGVSGNGERASERATLRPQPSPRASLLLPLSVLTRGEAPSWTAPMPCSEGVTPTPAVPYSEAGMPAAEAAAVMEGVGAAAWPAAARAALAGPSEAAAAPNASCCRRITAAR